MKDIGKKPELLWVPIHDLDIDPSYQRTTKSEGSRANIRRIQTGFSWRMCGALVVAPWGKPVKYAVIDGQHRLMAAKARGDIAELPCLVIDAEEMREQAVAFTGINLNRVALNPLARFHASVAAGDDDAVALKDILDECSIDVPKWPIPKGEVGPRQVQALGTLYGLLGRYSRKQIIWVLTIIPQAYGDEKGQLRASLIKALAEFIKQNPETSRDQMIYALQEIDPKELEENARAYMKINGGNSTAAILVAINRHYKQAARRGQG